MSLGCVVRLSVFKLNVVKLNVVRLSDVKLNAVMLSVIRLNVVMLSVVSPNSGALPEPERSFLIPIQQILGSCS
jgi:hypothetical protein